MKRVFIIHHSGYLGGAGVSLLHILKSISYLPLDVYVYCPSTPSFMINEIRKMGFKVVESPKPIQIRNHFSGSDKSIFNYRSIISAFYLWKSKRNINEMLVKIKPEIVIVNSMTLSYVGKIAKKYGIETICFHRETYAKGLFGVRTKLIKLELSRYFDKVVFISNYDLNVSGKLKCSTYVITDKVNFDEYRTDLKSDESIGFIEKEFDYVLYTGGMSKLKGAHTIIEALHLCNSNLHVLFLQFDCLKKKVKFADLIGFKNKLRFILGKDYQSNVINRIDKYRLWDRIHFYPVTTDVAKFYRVSDFVVFPSSSPHQARPIYEAGAAHKPIVITASENIAEFVKNEQNGFTFRKNDIKQLSKLMTYLVTNKKQAMSMGECNYNMSLENHNLETLKVEIMQLFDFESRDNLKEQSDGQ